LKRLVDPSDPLTVEQLSPEASELLECKLPENVFRPAHEEYEILFPLSVGSVLEFAVCADQGACGTILFDRYNANVHTETIVMLNDIIHPEQGQLKVPKWRDRLTGIGIDMSIDDDTKLDDVLV
jgi:hypothetical protein